MLIKKFGESLEKPLIQWYESDDGQRITCSEKEIDTLWWEWVAKDVARYTDKGFVVFEFVTPVPDSLIKN